MSIATAYQEHQHTGANNQHDTLECFMNGCIYHRSITISDKMSEDAVQSLLDMITTRVITTTLNVNSNTFRKMGTTISYVMKKKTVFINLSTNRITKDMIEQLNGPKLLGYDTKQRGTTIVYIGGCFRIRTAIIPDNDALELFDSLHLWHLGRTHPTRFKGSKFSKLFIKYVPSRSQTKKLMELCDNIETLVNIDIHHFRNIEDSIAFCDHISNLKRMTHISVSCKFTIPYIRGFTNITLRFTNMLDLESYIKLFDNNPDMTALNVEMVPLDKNMIKYIYDRGIKNGKLTDIVLFYSYCTKILDVDPQHMLPEYIHLVGIQNRHPSAYDVYMVKKPSIWNYVELPEISTSTYITRAIVPNTRVDMSMLALGNMEVLHCIDMIKSTGTFNNTTLRQLTISYCTMEDVEYLLGGENVITFLRIVNLFNSDLTTNPIVRMLEINKTVKHIVVEYYNDDSTDKSIVRRSIVSAMRKSVIVEKINSSSDNLNVTLTTNKRRNLSLLSMLL